MKLFPSLSSRKLFLPVLLAFAGLSLSGAHARIEPDAEALVQAVAAKLSSAQTIQLTAKHQLDPSLGVGSRLESGPLNLTFRRPNQFYLIQPAGEETREIAYNGQEFCLMQPGMNQHALVPVKAATIETFSDLLDSRYGFRPPITELLANDLMKHLMVHVTSASVVGRERVGWTSCDHLRLVQEGMTVDLWVGRRDKLPRRLRFTYTDRPGQPAWDIRLSKWVLNGPVDNALFSKRPPADSLKIQMVKSR